MKPTPFCSLLVVVVVLVASLLRPPNHRHPRPRTIKGKKKKKNGGGVQKHPIRNASDFVPAPLSPNGRCSPPPFEAAPPLNAAAAAHDGLGTSRPPRPGYPRHASTSIDNNNPPPDQADEPQYHTFAAPRRGRAQELAPLLQEPARSSSSRSAGDASPPQRPELVCRRQESTEVGLSSVICCGVWFGVLCSEEEKTRIAKIWWRTV